MKFWNYFTLALGTAAAIVPQVVPFIPPPYGIVASGAITAITAVYHLFQTSPANVPALNAAGIAHN